ncbi:hypothetical protein CYMTET_37447 [Cymbomonas tetramitiformis]|uniref:Uncharacterized protein n=1 Tax=Cymbomonas tetramitiformis TaxID=36881 RepID=A0AAE0F683_9CHLO|nr:hypothetical protein CYMTET_37447 [Cymbomonas tetramitiformis]
MNEGEGEGIGVSSKNEAEREGSSALGRGALSKKEGEREGSVLREKKGGTTTPWEGGKETERGTDEEKSARREAQRVKKKLVEGERSQTESNVAMRETSWRDELPERSMSCTPRGAGGRVHYGAMSVGGKEGLQGVCEMSRKGKETVVERGVTCDFNGEDAEGGTA